MHSNSRSRKRHIPQLVPVLAMGYYFSVLHTSARCCSFLSCIATRGLLCVDVAILKAAVTTILSCDAYNCAPGVGVVHNIVYTRALDIWAFSDTDPCFACACCACPLKPCHGLVLPPVVTAVADCEDWTPSNFRRPTRAIPVLSCVSRLSVFIQARALAARGRFGAPVLIIPQGLGELLSRDSFMGSVAALWERYTARGLGALDGPIQLEDGVRRI